MLTFSARGFGTSGGKIHLNSPDHEIADGTALLDVLGARSDVRSDGAKDPRVAVVGASYGGAFALMLAGADQRVDATVAAITWNDLSTSLFPQAAAGGPGLRRPRPRRKGGRPVGLGLRRRPRSAGCSPRQG